MNVNLDYSQALNEIVAEISKIPQLTAEKEKKAFQQIGKELVKEVKKALPRSDADHKHMADDVKSSVSSKSGICSVVVRGGKLTGYKWHMLDDGTRNPDGSIHTPATHFTQIAMQAATSKIDDIVDDLVKEVAKGD